MVGRGARWSAAMVPIQKIAQRGVEALGMRQVAQVVGIRNDIEPALREQFGELLRGSAAEDGIALADQYESRHG